ncbi:hypothetical protein P9112_004217 [Eukaryota sp. TZLM1-RC]
MPYTFDLLLSHDNLPSLRDALISMEKSQSSALSSLRYHTSEDTRVRALYTVLFLGRTQTEVGQLFWVHQTTISKWVHDLFEPNNKSAISRCVLTDADGEFLDHLLNTRPLLFLREIKTILEIHSNKQVSVSTIHRFLVEKRNFTRKKARMVVQKAKAEPIHSFSNYFRGNFGIVIQEQYNSPKQNAPNNMLLWI